MKENVRKITLGFVLSWLMGIIFIFLGLIALTENVILGILTCIGGMLIIPYTNNFTRKKWNFEISSGLKVLIAIIT
ncbi:MAG: hypothetical protein PHF86_12045, partial [Candidatus Nanoarchaeia archaeon]|nr:hypothetical protein [Candidatus Nanoarchaeia archaeon]